ncbi:hypothetical protein NL676_013056 [Syzygium grande]|nr:hypothetical protein NL676_013056 [Syzygium grande]
MLSDLQKEIQRNNRFASTALSWKCSEEASTFFGIEGTCLESLGSLAGLVTGSVEQRSRDSRPFLLLGRGELRPTIMARSSSHLLDAVTHLTMSGCRPTIQPAHLTSPSSPSFAYAGSLPSHAPSVRPASPVAMGVGRC